MMQPLTTESLAAALRAGQGRAYMHVQQFGLSGVSDLVLAACLKNQAYDIQCEPSRAAWLFSMFEGTNEYARFSSSIIDALECETDPADLQQLCELAALMAKRGNEEAHEALRKRVLLQAEPDGDVFFVGDEELFSLEGIAVVPDLARRYGRILINGPDDDCPPLLLDYLTDDADILAQCEKILQDLADSDPEIEAYLTYWHQEKAKMAQEAQDETAKLVKTREELKEEWRERIRQEIPLDKILQDASTEVGSFPGSYMEFGRNATQEELGLVLQRLEQETAEGVCLRLLWVFRRTPLPQVPPKVWRLAASKNQEVRSAAIEALAQLQHQHIGNLGRNMLRSQRFTESDSEILDLFIRNYLPGDEDLIITVLRGLVPTPVNAHSLCWSILAIAEENASPSLLPMLNWAYEMTPCSNCRLRALKRLNELGGLSQEIRQECLFDANEEIPQFAESIAAEEMGRCHIESEEI